MDSRDLERDGGPYDYFGKEGCAKAVMRDVGTQRILQL